MLCYVLFVNYLSVQVLREGDSIIIHNLIVASVSLDTCASVFDSIFHYLLSVLYIFIGICSFNYFHKKMSVYYLIFVVRLAIKS